MTLTEASTITLEVIDNFHNSLSDSGCSMNTARAYRADLRTFLSWTGTLGEAVPQGGIPLSYFDQTAVEWLKAERKKVAAKTLLRRITSLKAFGAWAGVKTPVLEGYRGPTPKRSDPHPIEEGIPGVLRMIEAATDRVHKCLCALTGLLGLRVSEARAVHSRDIDVERMTVVVRHGKGDKERTLPISPQAWVYIMPVWMMRERAGGGVLVPIADRTARDTVTRLARRAGLAHHVASHDMRATVGTATYRKTKDIRVVQEILGHASVETTQIYTQVRQNEMREALDL